MARILIFTFLNEKRCRGWHGRQMNDVTNKKIDWFNCFHFGIKENPVFTIFCRKNVFCKYQKAAKLMHDFTSKFC